MRSGNGVGDHVSNEASESRLVPGEIHVWWIRVPGGEEDPDGAGLLEPAEIERADAFRFHEDRRRFLMSRISLRRILANYTGRPPEELAFDLSEWGKPRLCETFHGIEFSLSRSGAWICVAVTVQQRVGVDIETMIDLPDLDPLVQRTLCPEERARFRRLDRAARQSEFYRIWTAKEAYAKCMGLGLRLPFSSICVDWSACEERFSVHSEDPDSAGGALVEGLSLCHVEGISGAMVIEGEVRRIDVRFFDECSRAVS